MAARSPAADDRLADRKEPCPKRSGRLRHAQLQKQKAGAGSELGNDKLVDTRSGGRTALLSDRGGPSPAIRLFILSDLALNQDLS
jgi:hypothetical protein